MFLGACLPDPAVAAVDNADAPPVRSLALQTASWEGVVRTLIKSLDGQRTLSPCLQLTMPSAEAVEAVGEDMHAQPRAEALGGADATTPTPAVTPIANGVESHASGEATDEPLPVSSNAVSSLGDAESSLGDAKSSLGRR
jgi:hypothetical protein